eukprot:c5611_g1_i1.p1 GENE.c5611_g1_i1~~c5611_g1_i1.p1  ORF type:complete len:173 (+),score=68.54 c5611_g1_i1:110-628(+)
MVFNNQFATTSEFNDDIWMNLDSSIVMGGARQQQQNQRETATSDFFKLPPQSLLRQVALARSEHSWIKCCADNGVCADAIFNSCHNPRCQLIHITNFKKEQLFYRTERCWEGDKCLHQQRCRFWHAEGKQPRRTAQENILFALREHMSRRTSPTFMDSSFLNHAVINFPIRQ